jgi:hypothetical protein
MNNLESRFIFPTLEKPFDQISTDTENQATDHYETIEIFRKETLQDSRNHKKLLMEL